MSGRERKQVWETERQEWERERETGVREKERDRGVRERKIKRFSVGDSRADKLPFLAELCTF